MNGSGTLPVIAANRLASVSRSGIEFSSASVVGVQRPGEHVVNRPRFHDLAKVHDDDAVADVCDDPQVMRDHHERHAMLALEALEQVENLRLYGHVDGRGRLIRDQQPRIAGERAGDHRPLAHASAQLEAVPVDPPLRAGDADFAEQSDRPCARRPLPHVRLVDQDRLDDLIADSMHRAERRHRLLKDEGDLLAADPADLVSQRVERGQVDGAAVAVQDDFASTIRPGQGTTPRMDSAITDLPQPLSPTTPRDRPLSTARLTPSTALTVPSVSGKYVRRSLTSISVSFISDRGRPRRAVRRRGS